MNTVIAGWISVLGAGATAASAALMAPDGPIGTRAIVVAVCAFFGGAGLAAKALYVQVPKPGTPPQG